MEQESLFDPEPLRKPSKPRPPDPIWNTLTELFGKVRTKSERGRRNEAAGQLREAEATPEEIRIAYEYCQLNYPGSTEMAICGHFSRALHEHNKKNESFENVIQMAIHRKEGTPFD